VPPAVRERYNLVLPPYRGTAQCVRLPPSEAAAAAAAAAAPAGGAAISTAASAPSPSPAAAAAAAAAAGAAAKVCDMRVSYEEHALLEAEAAADPLAQFDAWFRAAVDAKVCVFVCVCVWGGGGAVGSCPP
jgi:hypothetical protein